MCFFLVENVVIDLTLKCVYNLLVVNEWGREPYGYLGVTVFQEC